MEASTSRSTMCWTDCATSAAFHCSSSTSFAECEMCAWWKVCKNVFACDYAKMSTVSPLNHSRDDCQTNLANHGTTKPDNHATAYLLRFNDEIPRLVEQACKAWQVERCMLLPAQGNYPRCSRIRQFCSRRQRTRQFLLKSSDVNRCFRRPQSMVSEVAIVQGAMCAAYRRPCNTSTTRAPSRCNLSIHRRRLLYIIRARSMKAGCDIARSSSARDDLRLCVNSGTMRVWTQ